MATNAQNCRKVLQKKEIVVELEMRLQHMKLDEFGQNIMSVITLMALFLFFSRRQIFPQKKATYRDQNLYFLTSIFDVMLHFTYYLIHENTKLYLQ